MIQYLQRKTEGRAQNAGDVGRALRLDSGCATLLCMRGYDDPASAGVFLRPSIEMMHDPFLFEQMGDAVDCINAAVDMGDRICVYGDYDVDGIMAVTMLTRYLRSMGADVFSYIPQRHAEGYGLNIEAIDKVLMHGASLLITVDCGITAIEEAAYAEENGLEMIITDHHQAYEQLPEVAAIINPACSESYPFKHLCGAGVALKLIHALGSLSDVLPYLQYATMATIADIVQLTGENRVIAAEGLKLMNSQDCALGIKALSEAAGQVNRRFDEGCIGFSLAPRVNAAGRTGSPALALDLFLTDDQDEARKLAKQLDEQNKTRQEIEAVIMRQALELIDKTVDIVSDHAIVLAHADWNAGVIGIVASRLVERFGKPVILFSDDSKTCTGSGRSIKGVNLFGALDTIANQGGQFERYGGHEMAAGLTIKQDYLLDFKRRLQEYLEQNVDPGAYVPKVYYDLSMEAAQVTMTCVENLSKLAPFGIGNPGVVFRLSGVVKNAQTRGNGAHLSFSLDGKLDCIAFGQGRRLEELSAESVDMLCVAKINTFKEDRVQCEVRQIRIAVQDTEAILKRNAWRFPDAYFYAPPSKKRDERTPLPIDGEFLLDCLRTKPQGTLVLCFSAQGARECFAFIEANGASDLLDISAGFVTDERGYNALLLAPYLSAANIGRYKRIFVFDDCPNDDASDYLYTITSEVYSNGSLCPEYFASLQPTRGELIPVYKAMVALSIKEQSFQDFDAYYDALRKLISADKFTCKLALRVFAELSFIHVEWGGTLKVTALQITKKKELDQSPTYAQALKARARA